MIPQRISVKYFVEKPEVIDLSAIPPIFQRWIQEQALAGLFIDVADYKHVHEGPGVILIGHDTDIAMDMRAGRPGLLATRKRDMGGSLSEILTLLLQQGFIACRLLETGYAPSGDIGFRADEVEITFLDRLRTPNRPASLAAIRGEVEDALGAIYPEATVDLGSVHDDPRQPLTIQCRIDGGSTVKTAASQHQQATLSAK